MSEKKQENAETGINELPEWQRKVAFATNAAGMLAGPAAVTMAVQQARRKQGGIPRKVVEEAEAKRPRNKSLAAIGRGMRSKPGVIAGGATAIGLQTANWAGDTIAAMALRKKKSSEDGAQGKEVKVDKSSRDKWKSDQKKIKTRIHGDVKTKLERQKQHAAAEHKMAIDQAWLGVKHANLKRDLEMPIVSAGSNPVSKAEQTLISKSDEEPRRGSGVGVNPVSKRMGPVSDEEWEKGRKKDKRAHGIAGGVSGGVLGGALGGIGGAAWHDNDARKYNDAVWSNDMERRVSRAAGGRAPNFRALPKRPSAGLRVGGAAAAGALVGGGLLALGSRKAVDNAYNKPENRRNVNRLRMLVDSADDELETWSAKARARRLKAEQKAAKLEKRDRNFDAESDRQRRLGLITGAAAGGSALLGVQAARGTRIIGALDSEGRKAVEAGKPVPKSAKRGLAVLVPANKLKRRIGAGAGSAGLAALALAAYKHGQSENNRPWN